MKKRSFFAILFAFYVGNLAVFADEMAINAEISTNTNIANAEISHQKIAKYDLKTMIGQMIIVGFENTHKKIVKKYLKSGQIGGVLFLRRNIKSKSQFSRLTKDLLAQNSNILPFLCIDEEGGEVSRFAHIKGALNFKSARFVAQNLSLSKAYEMYKSMAKSLKFYNINLNFAPVVDVYNPKSSAIGAQNRAFSDKFSQISAYANEFIKAMNDEKIVSVMKHFPGHGSVLGDTHKQIVVAKNYDFNELSPYFWAIENDKIDAIMSAHVVISALDNKPASFSNVILNDLLRKKMKFNGVIFSDDLLMSATGRESIAKKAIKAIKAGNDVILLSEMFKDSENLVQNVFEAIANAIKTGEISRTQIEKSFERILALKSRL